MPTKRLEVVSASTYSEHPIFAGTRPSLIQTVSDGNSLRTVSSNGTWRDLWTMATMPGYASSIVNVALNVHGTFITGGAGSLNMSLLWRSTLGTDLSFGTANGSPASTARTTDPDSNQWTQKSINDSRFGFQSIKSASNHEADYDYQFVIVTYHAAGGFHFVIGNLLPLLGPIATITAAQWVSIRKMMAPKDKFTDAEWASSIRELLAWRAPTFFDLQTT